MTVRQLLALPFLVLTWLSMRVGFAILAEPWNGPASQTIEALTDLRTTVSGIPTYDLDFPGLIQRSAVLAAIGEAMTAAEAEL